ncbi:MAG: hypothetical protein R3D67_07780 [Hyphomicrobiaceae bacterium]
MTRTPSDLLRNWSSVLGYQALGFIAMIVTSMLATVAVPPRVFGDYYFLISLIQVALAIALSWIAQAVALFARREVQQDGSGSQAFASAVAAQVLVFLPVVAMAWVAWQVAPQAFPGSNQTFMLLITTLALFAVLESVSYALQAMHRFEGIGMCTALAKVGPLAAVLAVGAGAPATADVLLLGTAIGVVVALAAAYRVVPAGYLVSSQPRWQTIADIFAYGWRPPIAGAAAVVSSWMHIWFVRAYGGPAEAGVYAWAASLHLVAAAALMSLSSVMAPDLIDLAPKEDRKGAHRRLNQFQTAAAMLAIALPAAMGCIRFLAIALPTRYAAAGPVLALLIATVPAQLMTILSGPPDAPTRT